MRLLFVPLLLLSVLIGWTLGLTGCALSAAQGWDPPESREPLSLPVDSADMWTSPLEGLVMVRGDAGVPAADGSVASCGDGAIQAGETCDDGNTLGGDGCSALCLTE